MPAGLQPGALAQGAGAVSRGERLRDYDQCLATLTQWDRAVEGYRSYDEVVLWFEHDLFDQLLLVRLLDWFSARDLGLTRLSLISIAEHPAVPRFVGMWGSSAPSRWRG